jgi:peroxiredoxin/uncharacterized membrane protein YphA (DoxX/SURF4 family)
MIDLVALVARMLLAAVFAVAGTAKILDHGKFRPTIAAFGVPASLVNSVASVLPAAELVLAVLLLSAHSAWWAALSALGLLLLFILAMAANLALGRTPECRCFGQIRARPIGPATIARNGAFASCAGLIVWAGPSRTSSSALNQLAGALRVHPVALLAVAVVLGAVAGHTFFLWRLFRQHGRLLLRMDDLERRLGAASGPAAADGPPHQGLPPGTPAPSFAVATSSGRTLGLEALRQTQRPVMLIFSDSGCPACTALLPEISRWQEQYADEIRIAVLGHRSDQMIRNMAARHNLQDVLLQNAREVAESYNVLSTPAAVIIRTDGTIGGPVMVGRDAIAKFLQGDADAGARSQLAGPLFEA